MNQVLSAITLAFVCAALSDCKRTEGTPATGSSAAVTQAPRAAKRRLMIVGDSISAGPGCYKKYLLQALVEHRYANFEFVGEYDDDCGNVVRHSAVSCSTAQQYTEPKFTMPNCFQGVGFKGLLPLMTAHRPDVVLLQLGVNDIWIAKRTLAEILQSYSTLVEQARAANSQVVLLVAQIQKIRPDCGDDDSVTQRAAALVNAVPAWAKAQSTAESPVFVADLWSNSDWSKAETLDCVHPNDRGARKMGLNWFEALKPVLRAE